MRLQAWLLLEFFPRTAKTGVFCINSFTLWWLSTHRALDRGFMIRGHLAQVTQPVTASGSHQATATRTRQVLESSNENAIFQSRRCWVLCIFLWACGHDQPLCAAQLLQQLLWKQGAAPVSQGQIVQGVGLLQPGFGKHCKKMCVQSGSGVILKALHLPGVKQVPSSRAGTPPTAPIIPKEEL